MTAWRLPLGAAAFGGCMLAMASFLICVALWQVTGNPGWHMFLPYVLPGFPTLTLAGLVVGLIFSGLAGAYAGGAFALFFNLWNRLIGRWPG